MCFPKTSSPIAYIITNHSNSHACMQALSCMPLPAIPMHSHVTTSHPHALSCHYQPSPCTLMSLPAIPMHSHVTTSHPHSLSYHYQPPPCTLMSLSAIPMHSHVTTSQGRKHMNMREQESTYSNLAIHD